MDKITNLAKLTQLLSNNLKDYNIILQTLLNTNKAKEPRVIFDGTDTVTYIIPGCDITQFKIFKQNNNDQYFLYTDKKNLCYTNDCIRDKGVALHNRIILKNPTYDEVYNFLYTYYVYPIALNKDEYKNINKIFKRRRR